MIIQTIRVRILTHGHGLTASLGKKPISSVVRILPCQDAWLLTALFLPRGDAPLPFPLINLRQLAHNMQ